MSNEIHFKNVQYGFEYGAAKVQRLFSDKKKETVTIGIDTPKHAIQIYITKTGKVRVHSENGEWFLPSKRTKQ